MLGESGGTTGKATIEEIGRRRSFTRTLLAAGILALVQQPMAAAVRDHAGDALACATPGRLSLLVDGAFILTYVLAAYRGYKYVRCLRQPRWTRLARTALWVVLTAGAVDAVEDVRLWRGFGATTGECAGLSTGWLTWLMRAAGFHIMRQKVPNPYAPGTPELARLRRQTHYLLQGGQAKFRAALSVLYGLCVNLLLIGITLRAVAWVLGWFLFELGVVTPEPGTRRLSVHWRPGGSWWFLGLSTVLRAVGVALFLLEKVGDRWGRLPDAARRGLTMAGGTALAAGLPVAVLLLGVPGGLDLLNRLVRNDEVSAEVEQPTLPRLLLDLVDPNKQGVASFLALA